MTEVPRFLNHDEDKDKEKENPSIIEKLLKTRTLTLFDAVTSKTAKELIQGFFLLEGEDASKPITLYINSPGGEINSGFAIYDTIRFIKPEVKIICSGLCASIATVILMAAKKENRLSLPNSRFLIHQPLIAGQVQGQATDIEITANEILKTREKINNLLSEETGQSLDKVQKDTERDYWMNANETLEYGLITRIITTRNEIE